MTKKPAAGGPESILSTARHAARAGLGRSVRALALLNQTRGFDCPGCAWPEGTQRGLVEFCENGAKAVSHEVTRATIGREFFLSWPLPRLLEQTDRWLEAQGRLAEPMRRRADSEHFEPIPWDAAFDRIGQALRSLSSPNQAVFYTSGRTSNEAAFLYQLFAREFGTNNLPDCSNMCHESTGTGLGESIGIGKGTVNLSDFDEADLILVLGQNPGSNHPRMLTTLERAARRGCRIVSINPLRERGLLRFKNPQTIRGLVGGGTALAQQFVQVKIGGDIALLKGVMKELLALDAERRGVLDHDFIAEYTSGFETFRVALEKTDWKRIVREAGIDRKEIRTLAETIAGAQAMIVCWAMGLTQHRFGVNNVQEVMNLLLLGGHIGRPGAGPCPVRGHSNVQGDRTMGIWESPAPAFLDALDAEFGITSPREPGWNTIETIRALARGDARFFMAMGGNFARATPDTAHVERSLARPELGVHVATKLNRTHLVAGQESILLPCLGRTEQDRQSSGLQFVSVEDSMACVHRSQGRLPPISPELRSEPAIVAGIAASTLGARSRVSWQELAADYDRIREHIAGVVPGFEDMNARLREGDGFVLDRPPARRRFDTPTGKARFIEAPLPELDLAPGELLMMTIRSHDQYNTTIYSDDDRYRGVFGGRRVIFLHPEDLATRGLSEGDSVDITSHFRRNGAEETRVLRAFRALPYDVPRGCAATYFPEANPLVPVEQFADRSFTPAYKSIVISLRLSKSA